TAGHRGHWRTVTLNRSHSVSAPRRLGLVRSPQAGGMISNVRRKSMLRFAKVTSGGLWLVALFAPVLLSAQSFKLDSVPVPGDGGTDYLTADTVSGRVFVSRATHVMVLDARTGQVVGDIPETPRVHGIALVYRLNRGFTTNGGDSTVSIFDLQSLAL